MTRICNPLHPTTRWNLNRRFRHRHPMENLLMATPYPDPRELCLWKFGKHTYCSQPATHVGPVSDRPLCKRHHDRERRILKRSRCPRP